MAMMVMNPQTSLGSLTPCTSLQKKKNGMSSGSPNLDLMQVDEVKINETSGVPNWVANTLAESRALVE